MQYVNLGRSGLKVSRLCLGCMTYADPKVGSHPWIFDKERSRPFIRHAVELGITFFDTANIYSMGASEEVLGELLKEFARRDDVVIATKLFNPMRPGANARGLSRKAILTEIDASLTRLGTDYVDLYQIHRWDYETPIEETLETLHDLVRMGKVRYIGASSMWTWQFAKALYVADRNGWTRFVSMQNHMNLIYREEEREMLPLCQAEGVAVIPWSPLARGRLTRPAGEHAPSEREQTDAYTRSLYTATEAADRLVIEELGKVADARGLPYGQVALAWLLGKQPVTAPIIGATKLQHLDDAVAALDIALSADEVARLEAPYVPHKVIAFT